jgi:hypothetical protein
MEQNLYRKESMEKVTSPDQLNDYIRVAKPSVWILLAAVIILLSGIVCWSIFGHITTSVRGACSVGSDSAAYLYVSPDDASKLKTGMDVSVTVQGQTVKAKISTIDADPSVMDNDEYLQYYSGIAAGSLCVRVSLENAGLPEGTYQAGVLIESISPISFIIH